jgi:hypothetical protein
MNLAGYLNYMGGSVVLLFDAASATLSGSTVTGWNDSINTLALTPTGSPQYVAAGVGVYPGISFNGTTQYLERASATLPAYLPITTDECWLWGLVNSTALVADTTQRDIFGYGVSTAGNARVIGRIVNAGEARGRVDRGTTGTNDDTTSFIGPHVIGGRFVQGGASVQVKVDGKTAVTGAQTFTTSSTGLIRMGSSLVATPNRFFQGNIGMAFVVAGPMSAAQIAVTEGFLAGLANG